MLRASAAFSLGRLPRIEFGRGRIERLPDLLAGYGRTVLLVTGSRSFRESARRPWLTDALAERGVAVREVVVAGEPSPDVVDGAVAAHREAAVDAVCAIGGGSVLDAAKAIAGLLRPGTSVMDHLELVGRGLPYQGPTTPLVAVPTTAGTGSEATKNAVLSRPGPAGFKRSFRDDRLMAEWAIVDPDLLATCPPSIIAADGADAVSQLLEAYVATGAGPLTDALALAGLEAARDALLPWYDAASAGGAEASGPALDGARERMAFAALASGICLAHAGLGAAHGLAAPLGARFPIPHGVACGVLLPAAVRANLAALSERDSENPALERYARLGRLLIGRPSLGDADARAALAELLEAWRDRLGLPGLGAYGVTAGAIPGIVVDARGGSMRSNPITLTDGELAGILEAAV